MTLPKGVHIGKRDALSMDDTPAIRKYRGDGKNPVATEWTVPGVLRCGKWLGNMPFRPIRTDPAPAAGEPLLPVLHGSLRSDDFCNGEHALHDYISDRIR
jgi:hypothetical protein